jgi:Concanavalin A-like lectin/glucanases superfamily
MHRKSKAQSAVEFVSTYAFVFLIIAIILFLLFMFASVPTKILPFQCTAFSGFSCVDVLYTTAGNSLLQISLTDTQAGVVSIGSFGAKINNVAAMDGTCTRGAVLPGNTVTCTVSFPFKAVAGGIYTGVFNVSANYCTNGVGNISNTTCQTGNSFTYAGSFTVQVQKPTLPLFVGGFNGVSSYVALQSTLDPSTNSYSTFAWVYVKSFSQQIILSSGNEYSYSGGFSFDFPSSSGQYRIEMSKSGSGGASITSSSNVLLGTWTFVGFTRNSSTGITNLYLNGVQAGTGTLTTVGPSVTCSTSEIGNICGYSNYFNGLISNVQIYNMALTPAQVKNLYAEGIGGTPINTANNVGWWPLNNNANDVSGVGNNGIANNIVYNSLWISGYTAP